MERQKVTLRLTPGVVDLVHQVAGALELSPASLVDLILLDGLKRYVDDRLDLAGRLAFSDRGRYKYQSAIDPDGLKAAIARKANIT